MGEIRKEEGGDEEKWGTDPSSVRACQLPLPITLPNQRYTRRPCWKGGDKRRAEGGKKRKIKEKEKNNNREEAIGGVFSRICGAVKKSGSVQMAVFGWVLFRLIC